MFYWLVILDTRYSSIVIDFSDFLTSMRLYLCYLCVCLYTETEYLQAGLALISKGWIDSFTMQVHTYMYSMLSLAIN